MNLRTVPNFFVIVSEREKNQRARPQLLTGYADSEGMGELSRLVFFLKRGMAFVSLLVVLFIAFPGMALEPSLFIDGHINLTQDTMSQTTTTSGQNNVYLVGVYLRVSPKFRIYLGADVLSGTSLEKIDATTKAQTNSQDVLLGARLNFGKNEVFSLTAAYGVASKATYDLSTATDSEKWTGTSSLFRIGVNPILRGSLRALLTLNYYNASYVKETTSAVVNRTIVFPTVGLSLAY